LRPFFFVQIASSKKRFFPKEELKYLLRRKESFLISVKAKSHFKFLNRELSGNIVAFLYGSFYGYFIVKDLILKIC
jgi:hypothetical protein